jgi:hypothetical protein
MSVLPRFFYLAMKYAFGKTTKTTMKEKFYRFLTYTDNIDEDIHAFWEGHEANVIERSGDLIISASPEFLLEPYCKKHGFALLASKVDKHTGKYDGENCYGKEKVARFYEEYPSGKVSEFYSDSRSDTPMAEIADKAFLVKIKGDEMFCENWG